MVMFKVVWLIELLTYKASPSPIERWPHAAPERAVSWFYFIQTSAKFLQEKIKQTKKTPILVNLAFVLKDSLSMLPIVDCFLSKTGRENEERIHAGLNICSCSCYSFNTKKQPFKNRSFFITRGILNNSELKLSNEG